MKGIAMEAHPLAGLYPPITTAFADDERLDLGHLEANLARWAAEPLDGVVMPGSNSEAAFLSDEERDAVWRCCADTLRGTGKKLIAGTGAETTAETIRLTQGALVLPPYFYKSSLTHDALVAHYRAVAEASPIPLLLYNVPAFTGVTLAPATILACLEHPRVVGVKDSSASVVPMAQVLAARPDAVVLAGTGSALLPFLSIGGSGGILALANVAARPLRQVMEAFAAGDLATARRVQLSLVELNAAITARHGVAGLKYAMDCAGYYGGPTRRPLLPLGAAARAEIDRLIEALGLRVALYK
jgi:4-hydroxy-2-oxoglutarate aldolase